MQLKGLREAALEAMLEARKKGPFPSLEDFLCRVDIDLCGCEDPDQVGSDGQHRGRRDAARNDLEGAGVARRRARPGAPMSRSLFHGYAAGRAPPQVPQYSARTILEHELETLDFLISRHPLSLYTASRFRA